MLQLRNTPDQDCDVSPAQIAFGRPIRDAFTFVNRLEKFNNHNIRPMWCNAWSAKEDALKTRMTRTVESLTEHCRQLSPLSVADKVFLQIQIGHAPKKWDRSGTVVECLGCDMVKVDGSGRPTMRNRRFLRTFRPVSTCLSVPAPTHNTLVYSGSASPPGSAPAGVPEAGFPSPSLRPAIPACHQLHGTPASPPPMASGPPNLVRFDTPHLPSPSAGKTMAAADTLSPHTSPAHGRGRDDPREPHAADRSHPVASVSPRPRRHRTPRVTPRRSVLYWFIEPRPRLRPCAAGRVRGGARYSGTWATGATRGGAIYYIPPPQDKT